MTLSTTELRSVGWSTVRVPNIGHFGAFLVLKRVLGTTQWVTRSKCHCRKPEGERRRSISRQELEALPAEVGQLTNLTRLDLVGNQLTELPPQIGQLAILTDLVLDNNQLVSLPAEIGQLSNLTRLDLTGNLLTGLPAEIGQLSNLTVLHLTRRRRTRP